MIRTYIIQKNRDKILSTYNNTNFKYFHDKLKVSLYFKYYYT